jgi:hypothetical protein
VVDREDTDARMRRLRVATNAIVPPAGLPARILAAVQHRRPVLSWLDMLALYARWALVPAAVASLLLAAASWTSTQDIDHAVLVSMSVGYLP